jgi:predicted AAA+ superfamily ATPase
MVLKSEIEKAFKLQQTNLNWVVANNINQRSYFSKIQFKNSHIEVISGIRRCGKSTLIKQIMLKYKKDSIFFNFEDPRVHDFDISDFQKLDEVIGPFVKVYFFDEIQNVKSWEIYIRQLHDLGKKVYVTGSNSSLLSKELGTRLTGRHLRHELFPFSYLEYLGFKKLKNSITSYNRFLNEGGFPEYLKSGNIEILQNLLKDVVLRDIAIRHGVKNTKTLMDITLFLISNIGKEFSFNNIRNVFNVGSVTSVSEYLSWLEDAYVLFYLPKFSWSAKNSAVNPRKVYAIDNGLVNANTLSFSEDKGRLLENSVFLFLRQKQYQLYYFREKKECDFVVFDKGKFKMLIQVCEEVHNENMEREVNGLLVAMEFFKSKTGYILTKNQKDVLKYGKNTIHLIPVFEFITNPKN